MSEVIIVGRATAEVMPDVCTVTIRYRDRASTIEAASYRYNLFVGAVSDAAKQYNENAVIKPMNLSVVSSPQQLKLLFGVESAESKVYITSSILIETVWSKGLYPTMLGACDELAQKFEKEDKGVSFFPKQKDQTLGKAFGYEVTMRHSVRDKTMALAKRKLLADAYRDACQTMAVLAEGLSDTRADAVLPENGAFRAKTVNTTSYRGGAYYTEETAVRKMQNPTTEAVPIKEIEPKPVPIEASVEVTFESTTEPRSCGQTPDFADTAEP